MPQEQINDEIKWLEAQLEARKRELVEKSFEKKEERDVLKEIIKEVPTGSAPTPPAPIISDDAALKKAEELQEKEHEEIIEELVNISFSKNLASALKVANSLKNPHLLDEFHDALADRYYQKLLDARKINP
jgi:hypothetical protein